MVFPRAKILVVDDEPSVLVTLEAILRQEGYDVDACGDGRAAIQAISTRHYDLVLTDLKMPGEDGLAVLSEVRKRSPNTVTVMMTGYGSVDSALEAVQLGAYEYLLKPTEVAELKAAVWRSLERKRLSEVDTLYRISRTATSLDAAAIARDACEAARQVLGVSEAAVVNLSSESAESGPDVAALLRDDEVHARLQQGDIITSDDHLPALDSWAVERGIASCALVPGVAGGQLICVLCAHNAGRPYDFHASAQRFLLALAGQAALSLANAAWFAELQRNNRELAAANAKLRELDKLKSQFLSVATHELRTPLSVILGYNSMLAETLQDRLSDEERETLHEAVAACKRLIRLVNSMLDISQIESGKMRMHFAPADLRRLVTGVVALFQQEARKKNIRLLFELPARLPSVVIDSERIEQVLINLVHNALKFTSPGGSITVAVRVRNESQAVEVSVTDTGIGIAPGDQDSIFDEFAQVNRQLRRQREGSGLGLAIARRIVEAHEGVIQVVSTPGRGSRFWFTLPLRARQSAAKNAISA